MNNNFGYCIALLGPDGCGKTTLSDAFLKDIGPSFRGVKRYHLRPYAFEQNDGFGGLPVSNPHDRPPRSFLSSLIKLSLFFIDYTFGYLITAQKYKAKCYLVVFDRYYYDLIIDPVRYRFGASLWIAKLVGKLIKKPDLFIILTGDPQAIWARKKEVSLHETERQIKAYEEFAKATKNSLLIHTDRDLNFCRQQVSQYILGQIAAIHE